MALEFPGADTEEKRGTVEFREKIVARAAVLIALTCNEQGRCFFGKEIPDDAILLALSQTPEVNTYMEHLANAGADIDALLDAIEDDYQEAMTVQHPTASERDITPKDVIEGRTLSDEMTYLLEKTGDPNEYDPAWHFHMMLAKKILPSSFRSAYTHNGAGLTDKNIEYARSNTYNEQHPEPSGNDGLS